MKYISPLLVIMLFSQISIAKNLVLSPGQSKLVPLLPNAQVQASSSRILSVTLLPKHVRIRTKKLGRGFVRMGKKTYTIYSLPQEVVKHYYRLVDETKNIKGVTVVPSYPLPHITGKIFRLSDLELLKSQSEKQTFELRTTLSTKLKKKLENQISSKIKTTHEIDWTPKVCLLVPKNEKEVDKIKTVLNPYGICIKKSNNLTQKEGMIQIEIYIAEVSKDWGRDFGVQMPQSVSFNFTTKKFSDLIASLNGLEKNGKGQILAQPTLTVKNKKKSYFHAGGEYPIHSAGPHHSSTNWKKHGLIIEIEPNADKKNIHLNLSIEISFIDHSVQSKNKIPGFKTSKVNTHANIKQNSGIAVFGFKKHITGNNNSGLPLLKQVPILGSLFTSNKFINNKSELGIFIKAKSIQ